MYTYMCTCISEGGYVCMCVCVYVESMKDLLLVLVHIGGYINVFRWNASTHYPCMYVHTYIPARAADTVKSTYVRVAIYIYICIDLNSRYERCSPSVPQYICM